MMRGTWFRPDLSPGRLLEEVIADALHVRRAVFVEEQGAPAKAEPDALDGSCRHAVIYSQRMPSGAELPVATGRIGWADGDFYIGRVCVLADWRGQGLGDALMRMLLHKALEHGARGVALSAPEPSRAFFSRYGFVPVGEVCAGRENGFAGRSMRAGANVLRALFDCRHCARCE